jgi:uncharacterized protein YdaU (DUF1376 family)
MRLAERGAYRDLLDYQWEMGRLPNDLDRLARLLGCSRQEFDDVWPAIADKFVLVDGFLVNKRLEEHRVKAIEQRERKIQAAKRTNAKRYGERAIEESHTDSHSDTLSASPPSPSPSPSPEKEPEQRRKATDVASRDAERGTRIPLPFPVDDSMLSWAAREVPNVDVKAATAEFEDYWKAVPGAKGKKLDWLSTWRNRMRDVAKREKPRHFCPPVEPRRSREFPS